MVHFLKQGFVIACSVNVLVTASAWKSWGAQKTNKQDAVGSTAVPVERGIELASRGYCGAALPILKKALPRLTNQQLRYAAAMASAQCGMSTDQEDTVVESLLVLNREFPQDPRVLYITTRYYSELANRTAHRLLDSSPSSAEAQQLLAESYQARGQYEDAIAKYRKILEQYPDQPGVHYQVGQLILVKPLTPASAAEAKKEFEAELTVNPGSPTAEFMLGDLALRAQNNDEAIKHFIRATELDVGLPQPYLGLGMALNAARKFPEAIQALKKFVALEPRDPAGYYQLAIAFSRTGNKEEAERQMALQREAQKNWNAQPGLEEDLMQPH